MIKYHGPFDIVLSSETTNYVYMIYLPTYISIKYWNMNAMNNHNSNLFSPNYQSYCNIPTYRPILGQL